MAYVMMEQLIGGEMMVKEKICALCDDIIIGEPYFETINGEEYAFHDKDCVDRYKLWMKGALSQLH